MGVNTLDVQREIDFHQRKVEEAELKLKAVEDVGREPFEGFEHDDLQALVDDLERQYRFNAVRLAVAKRSLERLMPQIEATICSCSVCSERRTGYVPEDEPVQKDCGCFATYCDCGSY